MRWLWRSRVRVNYRSRTFVVRLMSRTLLVLGWRLICPSPSVVAQLDGSVCFFLERVNEAGFGISTAKSEQDVRQKRRRLLWAFDVPAIARIALDDSWDRVTAHDRKEGLKAFEEPIATAYVRPTRNKMRNVFGLITIIWSGLFERFEPLDVRKMMKLYAELLFVARAAP